MRSIFLFTVGVSLGMIVSARAGDAADGSLVAGLATSSCKLVYESYVENNWELFVSSADGADRVNLTNTSDQHELYPQVSPDGCRVCFIVDQGQGRQTVDRPAHPSATRGPYRDMIDALSKMQVDVTAGSVEDPTRDAAHSVNE